MRCGLFTCLFALLVTFINPTFAWAQMPVSLEVPQSDWPARIPGKTCGAYRCHEIRFNRQSVFLFVPEREMATFREHIKAANFIFTRQGATAGPNPQPVYVWKQGAVLADYRRTVNRPARVTVQLQLNVRPVVVPRRAVRQVDTTCYQERVIKNKKTRSEQLVSKSDGDKAKQAFWPDM